MQHPRRGGDEPADDAPLSLLHVTAPAPFGGLESVVRQLARGQAERGHAVHVVAVLSSPGEHPFVAALRDAGVAATALVLPGRAYLRERREVAGLCRRLGASVLHTHGYRPDVLHAPVARALGIARVSTVHGFCGGGWKNRLFEALQRRAFRRMDAVVAVSRALAGDLARSGVPADRLHTVPNAWAGAPPLTGRDEARRVLGLAEGVLHLAWVGRVSREKGLDVLVDALARAPGLPVSVSVLGDGPERARTEAQAAGLGVAERIRWHGVVPDAARLLRAFDGFVLSSRTEGTPISLLEAMYAGVPVVASRVGGVPEVVSGAEALLVAPADPPALAAALRTLAADPEAARARARAARERLERELGRDAWLDRYDRIYRHALSARRERRG